MKDLFSFLVSGGGIIPYSEEMKSFMATGFKCPHCGHRFLGLAEINQYSADGRKLNYWRLLPLFADILECPKCFYHWKYFRDFQIMPAESNSALNLQSQQVKGAYNSQPLSFRQVDQSNINIQLEKESERIRTSSETVLVPSGVKITVKRSRTIEHTVDVSWRDLKGGSLDLGFEGIVSMSIRGEVEKQKGRSYKESETIEYEVELNGEKVSQYNLIWTDIWCKGFIELTVNDMTQILPFRFRDSSELEVIPVEKIS